jgi:hypothetical protein
MQKNYFHNNKISNENKDKKKSLQLSNMNTKSIVDINILLNRIKIEEKDRTNRKFFFFSLVTLTIILFGIFIATIK